MLSIVAIVLAFGIIIFVHELGHFLVAKFFGIKVERFSFGLGREIFGKTVGETRYCLAWVPLGGEVRMAGEYPEGNSDTKAEEPLNPREFYAKPWYKRIGVVLAGPFMNYVIACIIFGALGYIYGQPVISKEPVIGELSPGKPAATAGLVPGDRILSVNDKAVNTWEDAALTIRATEQGKDIVLDIKREDQELQIKVTPEFELGLKANIIGIAPKTDFEKLSLPQAAVSGVRQSINWTVFTLYYLGAKIYKREKPDLAGPIGIAQVLNRAVKAGWHDFMYLIGLISVGVGLFNILPIPLLDGGHATVFALEGLFRRPINRKVVQYANAVGLSILMFIFMFATYNDIQRLRTAKSVPTSQETNVHQPSR